MNIDYEKIGFRKDYNENNRIVKQEYISYNGKKYFVSTVDLGMNHQFGEGNPLYYETMIFGVDSNNNIDYDLYCDRYETRKEALEKHNRIISLFENNKMIFENGYFREEE
jgi:hypothetical protein